MLSWLCIFHFVQCTTQGIKAPSENTVMGLAHWSLVSPCPFFLSLLLSFSGWSLGAQGPSMFTYLPGLLKTWTGRCSVSSLPQETGRAPAAYVNGASPLSWGFIGYLCKPRNISLFLSSIFLSATFFLYLSLYLYISKSQSPTPSTLRLPWIQLGLDPGSSLSLLQENFLTQELNLDLLHCRQILYQLSYWGSPKQK